MKHTEEDLAYAAGFLDGEGCFKFTNGTPEVCIENTYVYTLVWFTEMFGGTCRVKTKPENPKWRQAYAWAATGDNARNCINAVLPYLQEKLPPSQDTAGDLCLPTSFSSTCSTQSRTAEAEADKLRMEPLELVATTVLLAELHRRFDDSIFVASAKMTKDEEDIVLSLMGSYHSVLGLSVIARMAAESGDGPHNDKDENDTTN